MRFNRLVPMAMAFAMAGTVSLTGCSQTKEAATGVGDAAKSVAGATGDAAKSVAGATGDAASGVGDAAKEAASGMGDAAKTAVTATGQAALAPVASPVLELLKKGEADLKAGNVGAAVTAMGGFQSLWEKAGPVIQPLAGDKWSGIDTAAKGVISTFGNGAKPEAGAAGSAISGLLGPLSALAGK